MKTKKRPKKGAQASEKPVKKEGTNMQDTQVNGEDDRGMDFGGLPARDLKKNLGGCG